MTDICVRLADPAHVGAHPLVLTEAMEMIQRLRSENERVNAWNRQLEAVLRDAASAERAQ
jgi:hypothetical protein